MQAPRSHPKFHIDRVAPRIFFVRGTSSNWIIAADNGRVVLIDSGYPGEAASVDASIREAGYQPRDVEAVLVTHTHADHMGSVERYRSVYGATVGALAEEVSHLRREYLQQISLEEIVSHQHDPLFSEWFETVKTLDPFFDVAVAVVEAIPAGTRLPYVGSPVAIGTPGHTSGHASYYFPDEKILVSGDAFVTGHETSLQQGPQMLSRAFHHDMKAAVDSLRRFEGLDVRLILPGHGPKWSGSIAAATAAITNGVEV